MYRLNQRAGHPYTDPWGCVWETTDDGITGAVHHHPLASWDSFDHYIPPDPERTDGLFPLDWKTVEAEVCQRRAAGEIIGGQLPHGHTFLRLQDIRGYENLLMDMAEAHPNITRLIDQVAEFNYHYVMKWMALRPDVFDYPEDLGMQVGPMISPVQFRHYIKPVYQRIMQPACTQGCIISMHSDGDIRVLADDLVDAGVQLLNLQDLVNGIDWIAAKFSGKICINLDIDRQRITRFGGPAQVDALVCEEIDKLATPQGGLIMTYGMYPGIPLANARALMDAMERYMDYTGRGMSNRKSRSTPFR